MDAPRHWNAGKTIYPTIYFVTNPPSTGVPPARTATTHAAQLRSALPLRAPGRCACCRRTHRRPPARARCPLPRLPNSVDLRARRGAMQLALAIGTCERAASPILLTACALLPRCSQPQLRTVGLDDHRALDSFATTSRRDVDATVTRIRQPARPRALPLVPGGAKPVPVNCSP